MARPVLELAEVMTALMKEFPNAKFALLAQSRGGILVLKFLKDNRTLATRISHATTFHCPHQGGRLANLAISLSDAIQALRDVFGHVVTTALGWLEDIVNPDAFKELAEGSPLLMDLEAGETPLPSTEYHTFGGTSVRLTRIWSCVRTLDSAIPQCHWRPFFHRITLAELYPNSPVADSLPNLSDEITEGRVDLLGADNKCRWSFAAHRTNAINRAEALWDTNPQGQVLRILGEESGYWDRSSGRRIDTHAVRSI